jgi:hypothetical protein
MEAFSLKLHCLAFVLYLTMSFSTLLYGQQNPPRIAVISFNYINVSKSDAQVITGLFETALVNTSVYTVIEQNQINEILNAQEYALSSCTDEKCAIQVGQLIGSEQIVLGTLSLVEGTHILNAKIIDVATGVNVRADKVVGQSLSEITGAAELLAFKLAGLTYRTEAREEIAKAFGDIFVETEPSGADIYVNGVNKGVSPNLFSKVPVAAVVVEARKGSLYGMKEILVTDSTTGVKIILAETYGSLFIRSDVREVIVYLDGRPLGDLGPGFLQRISAGPHLVELKAEGLYWQGDVIIKAGESTRLEASPRAFGAILYDLPEGAQAEIEGSSFRQVVARKGLLTPVWEAEYTVRVTGEIYEPYKQEITIRRASTISFKPRLDYSREYEENKFRKLMQESEKAFYENKGIEQKDIDRLALLKGMIQASKHGFTELVADTELLIQKAKQKIVVQEKRNQLTKLTKSKLTTEDSLRQLERQRRNHSISGWSSFGASLLSFGSSALFWYLSDGAYENYQNATITKDVIKHRDEFLMWDTMTYAAWGVGGLGVGVAIILWATDPNPKEYQAELTEIQSRINMLVRELR